jgi:hypothetical protein
MSIGNTKEYGNKGNNFPYQLKSLQGLQCACDQLKEVVINTTGLATEATLVDVEINTLATTNLLSPISRTPGILRVSGSNGSIAVVTYSISFSNVGTANATVNTVIIKPGETINFDAGALNNTFASGAFVYSTTTSGAELLIIYTTV